MKKARKFLVLFLTLAIAVSVTVTNLTLSAFAADPMVASVDEISVPTELNVGDKIETSDVKGITHVREPKGALVAIGNGYTFKQAGYYSFAVVAGGVKVYEGFRTAVSVEDLTLKVNAAKVPTYVKVGSEIKLPLATLVDEDGKTVTEGYTFTYSYTTASGKGGSVTVGADATEWSIPAAEVTEAGSYFVTYTAKSEGDAATFTQRYTVQVQTDFEDKTDPSLNFAGVPSNINIRAKVTLPVATASDNFDSNVDITVSVKKVNGDPIYQMEKKGNRVDYVLDKDGEKIEAVFDNAENMSFYPDVDGDYVVTYTAVDDSGNKTVSSRKMKAADKLAPEIDVQTPELIPAKWGMITYNNTNQVVGSFKIPVAYLYDNAALASNAESVGTDDDKKAVASVSIRKDNTKIFDSANPPVEDYGNFMKRNETDGSYAFTLSDFTPKTGDKTGTYTITYKATDAANLITTKDYKFTVSGGSVTYKVLPKISYDKLPDYLVAGEEFSGFDVTVDATNVDEGDNVSKVSVAQDIKYFYKGQADADYKEIDLKDEDYTLPKTPGSVKVTVSALDAYGNAASENLEKIVDVIDFKGGSDVVISLTENSDKAYVYDRELSNASYDFLGGAGTIKVSDVADENKYVGFEAYVSYRATESAEAEFSKLDTEITYHKDANGVLTLTSAKIRPTKAGLYTLVLRGFDQGAGGVVKTMTVTVTEKGVVGPTDTLKTLNVNTKAAGSSAQVNAYTAQTLNYKKAVDWVNCDYIEVVAKGGRFSVMDKRFVPMDTSNTYSLKYKAVKVVSGGDNLTVDAGSETIVTNAGTSGDFTFKEITDQYTITGAEAGQTLTVKYDKYREKLTMSEYNAAVAAANEETNAAKKQWMLDKAMAEYLFPVPEVSVINKYGDVKVEIKVYAPGESESMTPEKDSAGNLYFYNNADGEYKITYTASSVSGGSETYEILVTSGDILKPELNVETVPPASAKKGASFKFSVLTASDMGTASSDLTYKRTIKFPDESVKTDSSYSNKGTDYELNQVGVYTVTYEVKDKAGNTTTKVYTIEVSEKKASSVNSQMISTVLIVVAALLIVGLLVYFFAFRKVDLDKKKKNTNDKK